MAITNTGKKLMKTAARWHDFIAKLSPENYARINKAGLIKPESEIIAGINKGTENIVKRLGYEIDDLYGKNPPNLNWNEARTFPEEKIIRANVDTNLKELPGEYDKAMYRALTNRHEAYEAAAASKANKKELKNPTAYKEKVINNFEKLSPGARSQLGDEDLWEMICDMRPDLRVGLGAKKSGILLRNDPDPYMSTHFDINVLTKERKLLDRNPYRDNDGLRFMKNIREQTGETQFINAMGKYEDSKFGERLGFVGIKNIA